MHPYIFIITAALMPLTVKPHEIANSIWNNDKTASASCSNNSSIPVCQITVKEESIDVSQVTLRNIRRIGIAELE